MQLLFNMGLCSLTLTFVQFKLLKSEMRLSFYDLCLCLHTLTHFHRCILHVQLNSIVVWCTRRTNERNPIVATLMAHIPQLAKSTAALSVRFIWIPFAKVGLWSTYFNHRHCLMLLVIQTKHRPCGICLQGLYIVIFFWLTKKFQKVH